MLKTHTSYMEITRLNMISDIVLPLTKVPQDFWKWGALLFAVFATCTSLFARIKLYIVQLTHSIKHSSLIKPHHHHHLSDQQQLNHISHDDDDNNDLTTDEELNSLLAYNVNDHDDEDDNVNKIYQDFNVAGLHTTGKNLVKQWDDLDIGGFHDKFRGELYMYDIYEHDHENVYTSLTEMSNGAKIDVYDTRMRPTIPVIYAEWVSSLGKVESVRYGSAVENVYLGYDGACRLVDLRNFKNSRLLV